MPSSRFRTAAMVSASILLLGVGCTRSVPPNEAATPPPTAPYVPITIDTPTAGGEVGNPLIASGQGIAFENTIQFRVKDANGKVLGESFTTADAPEYDAPGPWRAAIPYRAPETPTGFLEAYETSAQDGSELHLVRVPVRFRE